MISAQESDKNLVIDILNNSFYDNKSVNYIISKTKDKRKAMGQLMSYSFDLCMRFGEVLLSDDRKGCALLLYPERKKTDFFAIWSDVKLCLFSIGIANIFKVMSRENKIEGLQKSKVAHSAYLWFLGVLPSHQKNGTGSKLLREVLQQTDKESRNVYLETSTLSNLPWYQQFGFSIYEKLDLSYTLYFLDRKELL